MNGMTVRASVTIAFVVLCLLSGCIRGGTADPEEWIDQPRVAAVTPAPSAALSPDQIVLSFYSWYLGETGGAGEDSMPQLLADRGYRGHPLLAQAFTAKVDNILDHYEEAGSRDPFLCGFAVPETISAVTDNADGENAGVDLLLGDAGVTLRIALIRGGEGWLISDVSCP